MRAWAVLPKMQPRLAGQGLPYLGWVRHGSSSRRPPPDRWPARAWLGHARAWGAKKGSLKETQQAVGGNVPGAEVHRQAEVGRVGPVAARGNLVIAVPGQVEVGLGGPDVGTEIRAVVPVALHDGFRHPLEELRGMLPEHVRPDPGPRAAFVNPLGQVQKVVPPEGRSLGPRGVESPSAEQRPPRPCPGGRTAAGRTNR